ncbi:hypothetical protein ACFQ1M_16255 [Sungkyunkwania multivorans]|uniref:DUF3299 domain-containing protein n=1 Tax=Sungkyunkwania multivorans TaxID=1173618 RepID=A0ABW3D2H5_9FLAO
MTLQIIRRTIMLSAICLFPFLGVCQKSIDWKTLSDVTFKQEYVKEFDGYFQIPTFGASVKELKDKEVIITGYVLALDKAKNLYMLSKNPMASCFFCGGGGPETIMEVNFKSNIDYETDDIATLKGTLVLNKDDVNHTNYMLIDAVGF